ncbi:cupin-like domain-containing protein [Marinobacterium lutimaris]|uniref:Cupin-like domain-containing protein n=1 Tax=Marinobacterium lutimaris TaxID=568106 RepID=A0A1H5XBJ0_9GAMM|nr:cupin-like domain-containing protein [Marinobacterium lutimaris]SEG08810.1 Cupin-like domain-containing protein [Marinobacterium lutimaris]
MNCADIEVVEYRSGQEAEIERLIYQSKKPILFKISDFPDTFDLDFYIDSHNGKTSYTRYDSGKNIIESSTARLQDVLSWIKEDQPVRIFGQMYPDHINDKLVDKIPLWKKIPFRPRYFKSSLGKALYFFGGKGSVTKMHFDRERNSNLHVCLHGKKRVLLFDVSQSRNIYKTPLKSDSEVDFKLPFDKSMKRYPDLAKATCYDVVLSPGDMIYMPKKCWHYIEYIEHNVSATFAFYPKRIDQLLGTLSGVFYLGFSFQGMGLDKTPTYKKFSKRYIHSRGLKRLGYKVIESLAFVAIYPVCLYTTINKFVILKKRPY